MSIQKQCLQNNVVLLTEPIEKSKTVSIGFWFPVGSRDEDLSVRGITHFVEHLLFKGTNTKSAFDIACSFDKIGGYINAFTDREQTCVYCVVPSLYVEIALDIIIDMIQNSTFESVNIEKERNVVINEILTSLDDPEESAIDSIYEVFWPEDRLSQTVAGSVEDVSSLTREMLFGWYQNNFANGSLLVSIAGKFEKDIIVKKISTISKKRILENKSPVSRIWNSGIFFKKAPFQQEQLFFSFNLKTPLSETDYISCSIINAVIGDTMSSRLFQNLREENGLCYNVYSFLNLFYDDAFWCAYVSTSKQNVYQVIQKVKNEFESILEDGITNSEIQAAKEHLCGENLILSEDVENHMKKLAQDFFSGFDISSIEEINEKISHIEKSDIDKMLSFFRKDNFSFVIYGPGINLLEKKSIKKIYNEFFL